MAVTWKKLAYEEDVISNVLLSATGDMIFASAADTPARLGVGSNTNVLTLVGGIPAWAAAGTPAAHNTTHQNGGGDEISVAGLSGVLADDQNPTSHSSDHEDGGGDEISVAALSGLLADDQHVLDSEVTAVIEATPLNDLAAADGAISANGQQIQNPVIHQVADNTALLALTPKVGKLAMQVDTLAAYICTADV